jgi:biopolymer transport protein ExbD
MAKRAVPEIGAGSMSDISFLLLTFFLLTSSVDQNKGMSRRLPPMVDTPQEQQIIVKERNILLVKVNSNDRLSVNREVYEISLLKERVKQFLVPNKTDETLPEVKDLQIDGLGMQEVSQGVVSLSTDRGTSYKTYMAVQNEIMKAYNELRDEFSMARFGKQFDALTEEQQTAVKDKYPLNLSEAEPTDVRKTK